MIQGKTPFAAKKEDRTDWSRFTRAVAVGAFGIAPNLIVWYQYGLPTLLGTGLFKSLTPVQMAFTGAAIDQTTFAFWIISNYLFYVSLFEYRDA